MSIFCTLPIKIQIPLTTSCGQSQRGLISGRMIHLVICVQLVCFGGLQVVLQKVHFMKSAGCKESEILRCSGREVTYLEERQDVHIWQQMKV